MRTLQHQLQDLADWIAGMEIDPKPTSDSFTEGPLREAWRAIADLPWLGDEASYRQQAFCAMANAMAIYPNGIALLQRIKRVIPSTIEHPFPSLAQLAEELRPVEWLWPGWLPAGMLTLLAARPGVGKSLVALDLAGRIMTGSPWPDGAPHAARPSGLGANVIYVDAENIPEVHNERAVAWGLPRERLFMLLPNEEDVLVDLSTSKYQELLTQMVFRLAPALVIVDSLGASLGKGENAVEDVRGVLGFLAGLSLHHRTAVLIIHHLRKAAAGQLPSFDTLDPDQIRGSGHITAMSRVVWGLTLVQTGSKPDPNGPRRLQVIKSTLARHPQALGVTLEAMAEDERAPASPAALVVPAAAGVPGAPALSAGMVGAASGGAAATGLLEPERVRVVYDGRAPEPYRPPTERDAAAEWLLDYLAEAGKPVAPKQVIAAAQEAGFSRSALYRARDAVEGEVLTTRGAGPNGALWQLAHPLAGELANQV